MENVTQSPDERGEHEKKNVALSSVVAAVFLTSMKLVVDCSPAAWASSPRRPTAVLTSSRQSLPSWRFGFSGRPPDSEHHYGHGKVENLSALIETLLLLATCVWIIYEAITRLFFEDVSVKSRFGASWSWVSP